MVVPSTRRPYQSPMGASKGGVTAAALTALKTTSSIGAPRTKAATQELSEHNGNLIEAVTAPVEEDLKSHEFWTLSLLQGISQQETTSIYKLEVHIVVQQLIKESHDKRTRKIAFMVIMNVAGALESPKGKTSNSTCPNLVVKVVLKMSPSCNQTF
ncbi:hypothetical protein BDK51DRAFT_28219 [Blyttiomyces helicus]|uniref:Uncharacterized protein n=1 Tax=Blyttiomyces helicus TaxID=388810 RepID=A0A4P9WLP9_9FUNG|nr:hypothetical protein BDK51DRAFT_28219 [Blyttiomyces helicus]|eukprot:RKO92558.1 hypothetical protein BDK51DRAFT_28219 [Blyttiomyces helicus]